MSRFATRMDQQQEQLSSIQAALMSPTPESGAIPKRREAGVVPQSSCAQDSSIPSLQGLRADAAAAAQAASTMEALDLGGTGNFSNVTTKATKRGWARPGGENAPRVQVPWPQDFIIGQGRKSRLLYDELDIMQFVQGCISITDRTNDPAVIRAMLEQLRLTLRDAQSYGFEAARLAYGVVLSQMEYGTLSWHDGSRISEEPRSALVARGPPSREVPVPSHEAVGARACPASANAGQQNIPNCPGGGIVTRVCNFFNQGVCSRSGDHQTGNVMWRHICKKCFAGDHAEPACPLPRNIMNP
jgi:hypothetical protein